MRASARTPDLFVLGSGQDDNIGDVILRREFFDRLRGIGRLHLHLGNASSDFQDALRLHRTDVVYADLGTWHRAAWQALARREVWFVDKPGELLLGRSSIHRNVKLLPLVMAVRLRGGQVLRLGLGVRVEEQTHAARLLRLVFRMSTILRWRDTQSVELFGYGEVAPDWAFAWSGTAQDVLDRDRSVVAVTFRGDRPLPSDAVLVAVQAMAARASLRLTVVTQVRRDAELSAQLATRLNAELVPWPADRSLAEHESVLRGVYRSSGLVISDRLHALIVGMTEGAAPLCLSGGGEGKVARHLDAVGFGRSCVSAVDSPPGSLTDLLESQIGRRAESTEAVLAARAVLDALSGQLTVLASKGKRAGARRS